MTWALVAGLHSKKRDPLHWGWKRGIICFSRSWVQKCQAVKGSGT